MEQRGSPAPPSDPSDGAPSADPLSPRPTRATSPAPAPQMPDSRSGLSPANSDGSPVINLRDVSVNLGGKTAISHVSLVLKQGRALALVGANGSGKSTVLNLMAGLLTPSQGSVLTSGSPRIGYVTQRNDRERWMPMTAREVLRMGRFGRKGLLRRFGPSDWMAIGDAATRMEITSLLDQQFGNLSGGQQQRVVVAQALAGDPDVLLMDEPLNGLDPPSQETILHLVNDVAEEGLAVAVATHDLGDAQQFHEVALMATKLQAYGPPEIVLTERHLQQAFSGRFHRV